MTTPPRNTYAWCFDHGRHHVFTDEAWCSGWWVALAGDTEVEALLDKHNRYGEARFYNELPQDVQVALAKAVKS